MAQCEDLLESLCRYPAVLSSAGKESGGMAQIQNGGRPGAKPIPVFPTGVTAWPYFSANLHPILGVPVRRLWK